METKRTRCLSRLSDLSDALWGLGESLDLLSPEERPETQRLAYRASHSMRAGTPGYVEWEEKELLKDIRFIQVILTMFRVRNRRTFWESENDIGEEGFTQPFVLFYEKHRRLVKVDGKLHGTAIEVETVKDKVHLKLFPYGKDDECCFEMVMDGEGADILATWLQSKGRLATVHHQALNKYYGTGARGK